MNLDFLENESCGLAVPANRYSEVKAAKLSMLLGGALHQLDRFSPAGEKQHLLKLGREDGSSHAAGKSRLGGRV